MSAYRGKTQKDEVRDDEGRRRFHGAFTGGFSAGYFNSVGSQEGWEPATFQSSRENRAQGQGGKSKGAQQRPEDFMDEEDGLLGRELQPKLAYDTLGEASKQLLRRQVEKEAVGSVIPGMGMVDELLAPTDVAVGKKLLQMMGWKEGVGVGSRQHRPRKKRKKGGRAGGNEVEEEEEEDDFDSAALLPDHLRHDASLVRGGKIMFSRPDVGVTLLPTAKNDLYGLGFDPVKDAPEFNAFRLQQGREREGGRTDNDDGRGVYRMGDVLGKGTSSRAGRRNMMGFALDEEEDDVYDDMGGGGGEGGGKSSGKVGGNEYLTVLGEDEEEDEDERMGRRSKLGTGAAKRLALEEWIGGGASSTTTAAGGDGAAFAPLKCPTDSRPVPDGFVLGVEQMAFKQLFWAPPTPPRGFVPFHHFKEDEDKREKGGKEDTDHAVAVKRHREANQGRLVASARGSLLGEVIPKAPMGEGGREAASIFDLMSQGDRQRIQAYKSAGAAAAVSSAAAAAAAALAAPAVPAPAPAAVVPTAFQGMRGALAKRFSVAERPTTMNSSLPEGLIEGGRGGGVGGMAPSVALPPPPPKVKPVVAPVRSELFFYPVSLLCKRFNVPLPQHARLTPASSSIISTSSSSNVALPQALPRAFGGGGGGGGEVVPTSLIPQQQGKGKVPSLLSNKFDQEMEALLPTTGVLQLEERQFEGEEEEGEGGEEGGKEAALPAFEEKARPTKDFFKAIFEASSSSEDEDESKDEDEDEGGEEEEEEEEAATPAAAAAAATPKLAGDAPTPPRVSAAPQDHYVQPIRATEGETMDELLAKGPMMISKKKKRVAVEDVGRGEGGEEGEEEDEGLVFGTAVLKRKKAKNSKSSSSGSSSVPDPAEAKGGAGTPSVSTLRMGRDVPPTPPRLEEMAAALVTSSLEGSLPLPTDTAAAASAVSKRKEKGDDEVRNGSSGGGSSDEDIEGSSSSSEEEGPKPLQAKDDGERGGTCSISISSSSSSSVKRRQERKEKKRRKESKEKRRDKEREKERKKHSKKRKHSRSSRSSSKKDNKKHRRR